MKHALSAGILALSLALSSTAFAKDLAPIELFSGDYIGVAGVDVDQLAKRDLYKKVVSEQAFQGDYSKAKARISNWTDGKFDVEKDIDAVVVAIPTDYNKNENIAIVDLSKSSKDIIPVVEANIEKDDRYERREVEGVVYYLEKRTNEWMTVLSDKRLAMGSEREVKAVVASNKAGKSASPVKKNSALYKQYEAADKKADVWVAFVMPDKERKQLSSAVLDGDGGKSFKAADIDAGNMNIKLASGLKIDVNAKMKSEASAADGSAVINGVMSGFLSDPALKDMGLGFLSTGIKVSSAKSELKGSINFSKDDVAVLYGLAMSFGQQMIPQAKSAKTAAKAK